MRLILPGLVLALAPGVAMACEFHGGPWGMAFARMMHAGPSGGAPSSADATTTPDAQAQANDAALAALRAQFLQRFNVRVDGEPAAAAAAGPAPPPVAPTASAPSPAPMP